MVHLRVYVMSGSKPFYHCDREVFPVRKCQDATEIQYSGGQILDSRQYCVLAKTLPLFFSHGRKFFYFCNEAFSCSLVK